MILRIYMQNYSNVHFKSHTKHHITKKLNNPENSHYKTVNGIDKFRTLFVLIAYVDGNVSLEVNSKLGVFFIANQFNLF